MKITNIHGLPEAIVAAMRNDGYSRGAASFSATELLLPSRLWALKNKWHAHLTVDASEMTPALFGKAVHQVLENAGVIMPGETREQRLFATFAGHVVSGQLDLRFTERAIEDYKTCKTYKLTGGPPSEWVAQLNIYNALAAANDLPPVEHLRIHAWAVDWSKRKTYKAGYPKAPIQTLELPMWEISDAIRFIEERIGSHLAALEELPECTPEERWARPRFAVLKKPDAARAANGASKFETKEDAEAWLGEQLAGEPEKWATAVIQERSGTDVRCEDYCPVRDFCTQYRQSR